MCAGGVQHTIGKLLMRAISLLQTLSQSEVGTRSYERPKSRESKPGQFQDSTLGVPGKKCHSDASAAERRKEYFMGEGGGFPRVRAMVSQMSPRLPVACPNTKSVQNKF